MPIDFPPVGFEQWRAQVEKDLGAKPLDTLSEPLPEGVSIAPLYATRPAPLPVREFPAEPVRLAMRLGAEPTEEEALAEVGEGADALWLPLSEGTARLLSHPQLARCLFLVDPSGKEDAAPRGMAKTGSERERTSNEGFRSGRAESRPNSSNPLTSNEGFRSGRAESRPNSADPSSGVETQWAGAEAALAARGAPARVVFQVDPLGALARGELAVDGVGGALEAMAALNLRLHPKGVRAVSVSTLPYHHAGADAADELAYALSTGVCYLEALLQAGLSLHQAQAQLALQVSLGRNTWVELCKLRALRVCWRKMLVGAGLPQPDPAFVHAVCSRRTLTLRDPWTNMLRVTTQTFAGMLGGADVLTPHPFDLAFGPPSALGRRVARNTGLVLREESGLGKVADPAGGAYFLETLTDGLAREGWRRFQALEKEGGMRPALESGRVAEHLQASWKLRRERVAKRQEPILGVSEFAHLEERLPRPLPIASEQPAAPPALSAQRDAAEFEALRERVESRQPLLEAQLVTLGPPAESRPRVGFATSFFAAAGIRARERTEDQPSTLVCLCGSDERYAEQAVATVAALKALGCQSVWVAGRPKGLEKALREAGVDGFIYLGCDVLATLTQLAELGS